MVDGIFHCSFTRKNFVEGEKDVFDLNKDWFMMFAEGPAVNGKFNNCRRDFSTHTRTPTHRHTLRICNIKTSVFFKLSNFTISRVETKVDKT